MNFETESFTLSLDTRPNQDAMAIKFFQSGNLFAAVADGVGGHEGGEVASNIAIKCAEKELANGVPLLLGDVFEKVVDELENKSKENNAFKDMATTLSLIVAFDGKAHFGHVGDSRIYHLRNEGILQITKDQTEAAELVRQGILTIRKAKTYPRRSVLVSALSVKGDHHLLSGSFDIKLKDRILLVTDGVHRLITKKEIRDLSIQNPSLTEFTKNISRQLELKGLKDDATFVAIEAL